MLTNFKLNIAHFFALTLLIGSLTQSSLSVDQTLSPKFLVFALACLLLITATSFKSETFIFKKDFIIISYLGYLAYCLTAIFWAHNKAEAIFDVSRTILGFLFFTLTVYFLNHFEKIPQTLTKTATLLTFILAAMLCFQFNKFGFNDRYLITGVFGHKNLFASFLILLLFFLTIGIIQLNKTWKMMAIAGIVINCLMIYLLQSRGVWLGLFLGIIGFTMLFFLHKIKLGAKIKAKPLVWIIAALVLFNILFLVVIKTKVHQAIITFKQVQQSNNLLKAEDQERLVLWDKTYSMISKKPLQGVGPGNWQIAFPNETLSDIWRAEDLNVSFQRPHNDFLWILSELGLVGFNLFLLLFIGLSVLLLNNFFYQHISNQSLVIILPVGFFIAYFTAAFFDFPKERFEHTVWLNVIVGYAYFLINNKHDKQLVLKSFTLHKSIPISLALICSFIAYKRLNGEIYYKKLLEAKAKSKFIDVIRFADKAENFVFNIDAFSVPLQWYKASAQMGLGYAEQAKASFMKAYDYNPYQRNVLNDLGSAYYLSGDKENAKKYYTEAYRISPRFDDAKLNLCVLLIKEGKFDQAEQWFRKLNRDSDQKNAVEAVLKQNNRLKD